MVNDREERICFGPTLSSALDNHPDGTQEDGEPLERGRKRKDVRWHSTLGELRLAFAGGAPSRSPSVSPPLAAAGQVDRPSRNMWNRLLDLEVILDGGRALCV